MSASTGLIKAVWLYVFLMLCPINVSAQSRYSFNLPAQPLADSLRAVGRNAHVTVAFDPALVLGRRAPPLRGRYSAQEALERLIRGSRLRMRMTERGSYWVEAPAAHESTMKRIE